MTTEFLSKQKKTHHPRVSKSAFAVAKGGGESGGTGFVVPGRLAVVGGGIDGDGPHTGGVSVTVTVVVRAAVARRPHVDVATPMSTLRSKKRPKSSLNHFWWGEKFPARSCK